MYFHNVIILEVDEAKDKTFRNVLYSSAQMSFSIFMRVGVIWY